MATGFDPNAPYTVVDGASQSQAQPAKTGFDPNAPYTVVGAAPAASAAGTSAPTGAGTNPPPAQGGVLQQLAGGAVKALVEPAVGAMNAYSRLRAAFKGEQAPSTATMSDTQPETVAGKVGHFGGEAAEFAAGGEVLDTIGGFLKVAEAVPELLPTLERFPKASKMILDAVSGASKGAALGAATGAAKASAHGEDVGKAAKSGAVGGAVGGAVSEVPDMISNADWAHGMINRASDVLERHMRYGADPAAALLRPDMPLFAGLTNRARQAVAVNKLNEIMPQVDQWVDQATARMPITELRPAYTTARQAVNDLVGVSDAKRTALNKAIDDFEADVNRRFPNGSMSMREANDLKQKMHASGADYDAKPDAENIIMNLYRDVHGMLKDTVNKEVPQAAELNQQASDLIALKDAATRTLGEIKRGAGPLTKGPWRDIPLTASGHVAPTALRAGASAPVRGAVQAAGADAEEATQAAEKTASAIGRILFRDSAGNTHTIPEDQLQAAQQVDPQLTVLGRIEGAAGAAKDAFLHGRPAAEPATDANAPTD